MHAHHEDSHPSQRPREGSRLTQGTPGTRGTETRGQVQPHLLLTKDHSKQCYLSGSQHSHLENGLIKPPDRVVSGHKWCKLSTVPGAQQAGINHSSWDTVGTQ